MSLHRKVSADLTGRAGYDLLLRRKWLTMAALACLLASLVLVSLTTGSSGLTLGTVLETLAGGGTAQTRAIVCNVRLPRIAAALAVGAALALSGCVMQGVLHNPLASASTLGVSQGAAFGAALAIIALDAGTQNAANAASAVTIRSPGTVTVCAFLGGLATTAVVLGSILYKACVSIAISLGLEATHMKLITAVLFLLILVMSQAKRKKVRIHA